LLRSTVDSAPRYEINRPLEHGQRLQAQKVELHQPGRLDPFHVELGRRHRRFRIAVERHQLGQRPIADDDAGGMGRGVGGRAPRAARRCRSIRATGSSAFAPACSRGSSVDGLLERDRIGRVLRHELGELVDLAVAAFEHPADVAQHAARLQGAEGDDLRDPVAAVALLDVGDHFVAPLLAEVDVEIRHRHALGIEEALEQEAEAHRIEIGDGERVGDQRARARAAARPDRNALRLRPLDEVGDDEEIAGDISC
jgi:hypothetical protein